MIQKFNDYQGDKVNELKYVFTKTNKKQPKDRIEYDVDAPVDDEVIKEDGLTKYKKTLNTSWLEMKIEDKSPFFVIGHAGWAKTSIIKKVAKAHGLTVVTVYLDKALPEDLGGIPTSKTTEDGVTYVDTALPKWAHYIHTHPEDDFLVFFDEMNQASPDVQNALMPILLESVIGGIKFDNIWYGAAGNFAEENASISDLSAPLRSRFIKENIWNESWEDAFEYVIDKYQDKLPKDLLDVVIKNNICVNPRELSNLLQSVITKKESKRSRSIEELMYYYSDFNKLDKTAETKKIVETIYTYLSTDETETKTKKPTKASKLNRGLSTAIIKNYANIINNGGYIDSTGVFVDLTKDWKTTLKLTPETAELIKKELKTK